MTGSNTINKYIPLILYLFYLTIAFLYNLDILNNQYNIYCNTLFKNIKEAFDNFITAGNNRDNIE